MRLALAAAIAVVLIGWALADDVPRRLDRRLSRRQLGPD